MADRLIQERLQPSLLDRLTDDHPDQKTEPRDARVIDMRRLRDIIRRDLSDLLNAGNLESVDDIDRYPNVQRSVLNYGVEKVAGEFSTEERALLIRRAMRDAIERFEPRINRSTLEIVVREREDKSRGATITFDIRAEMWAQPVPLELYLRSEVDLTSGKLSLNEAR